MAVSGGNTEVGELLERFTAAVQYHSEVVNRLLVDIFFTTQADDEPGEFLEAG